MVHKDLADKAEFEQAIATKDKNVLIYIYEGTFDEKIDEHSSKFAATTDAYKADAGKEPKVKDFFKVSKLPTVVVYKNGSEIKRVEGENPDEFKGLVAILR